MFPADLDPNPLEQLRSLDPLSPEFPDQISGIFYTADYKQWVQEIPEDEAVDLIEYLDKVLGNLNPSGASFRRCLRQLRRISSTRMVLPRSYTLSSQFLQVSQITTASTNSRDVFGGVLGGLMVRVKRVRVYAVSESPERLAKALYQEAIVWRHLKHKNIISPLGITPKPLQLVSQWMPDGDLTEYIEHYPNVDRLGILHDVAEGLCFLHSWGVIHGGLKGWNILIDVDGRARITDFGLVTVIQNVGSVKDISNHQGNTSRWTAPEILNETASYSEDADIFSFAMVMIEVYTGAVPFNPATPAAAMLAIMSGKRPQRPAHTAFTNDLWELMQRCWAQHPGSRPDASGVLQVLNGGGFPTQKSSRLVVRSSSILSVVRETQSQHLPRATSDQRVAIYDVTATGTRKSPGISSTLLGYDTPNPPANRVGDAGVDGGQNMTTPEPSLIPIDLPRIPRPGGSQQDPNQTVTRGRGSSPPQIRIPEPVTSGSRKEYKIWDWPKGSTNSIPRLIYLSRI